MSSSFALYEWPICTESETVMISIVISYNLGLENGCCMKWAKSPWPSYYLTAASDVFIVYL